MSAGVRAFEVDTYQQARGGKWVARIDAREAHGDAVAETQEHAELLAEGFRRALAAMRAAAGPLVLEPEGFEAARAWFGETGENT